MRLPGATITKIIEQKVSDVLDAFPDLVKEIYPDGIFPGTKEIRPGERLTSYIVDTASIADLALLANPNYVDEYQAGLAPPPQSPDWLNALSLPEEFRRMQADFMKLLNQEPK